MYVHVVFFMILLYMKLQKRRRIIAPKDPVVVAYAMTTGNSDSSYQMM